MADDTRDEAPERDAQETTKHQNESESNAALGDAGKRAIEAERSAKEAAEKEAKRLQKLLDAHDKAQRDAEAKSAEEQGNWEKIANQHKEELDRLATEIAKRDHDALRAKVAAANNLPSDLADLLSGDDEAALTEQAKRLAKHIEPRKAPDTEAGAGTRGATPHGDRPPPKAVAKEPTWTFDRSAQKVPWPD